MAQATMSLGVLSAHGMARTAQAVPSTRRPGWRDDEAFAALVGPLSRSFRWRLRTQAHRLACALAVGPRARAAHGRMRAIGAVVTALAATGAAASVLVVTLADAYTTPFRLTLPQLG